MYKCLTCGHVFESGEEKVEKENHGLPGGFYEEFRYCPDCGGDFEEACTCWDCDEYYFPDELYAGKYCRKCLTESVDYDTFWECVEYNDLGGHEQGMLEHFFFTVVWRMPLNCVPKTSTPEFKAELKDVYLRMVAGEKLMKSTELLNKIVKYVTENEYDADEFAEWLYTKRSRKDVH